MVFLLLLGNDPSLHYCVYIQLVLKHKFNEYIGIHVCDYQIVMKFNPACAVVRCVQ